MIPLKNEYNVITNTTNETNLTVSDSGFIFDILANKLYTHKIPAVVREISCNAYDSHVAAGKPDVPFKVVLPSKMYPFFEVEDQGTGLSEEDIYSIYSVLGTSTKRDSNQAIGFLGIGSKSPLAYSKTFQVVSRKDGVQCTYTIYIGSDGRPVISKISECETDQPNGLKVQIPVLEQDFYKFANEAKFIFSFFKVKPTVLGDSFELTYKDATDQLEQNKMYCVEVAWPSSSLYNKPLYAVMGGVCYSVDKDGFLKYIKKKFDGDLNFTLLYQFMRLGTFFIKFEMGDLSFSPSREQLEFNSVHTEKYIYEYIYKILNEQLDKIKLKASKITNIQEALNLYESDYTFKWLVQYLGIELNGVNIYNLLDKPRLTNTKRLNLKIDAGSNQYFKKYRLINSVDVVIFYRGKGSNWTGIQDVRRRTQGDIHMSYRGKNIERLKKRMSIFPRVKFVEVKKAYIDLFGEEPKSKKRTNEKTEESVYCSTLTVSQHGTATTSKINHVLLSDDAEYMYVNNITIESNSKIVHAIQYIQSDYKNPIVILNRNTLSAKKIDNFGIPSLIDKVIEKVKVDESDIKLTSIYRKFCESLGYGFNRGTFYHKMLEAFEEANHVVPLDWSDNIYFAIDVLEWIYTKVNDYDDYINSILVDGSCMKERYPKITEFVKYNSDNYKSVEWAARYIAQQDRIFE